MGGDCRVPFFNPQEQVNAPVLFRMKFQAGEASGSVFQPEADFDDHLIMRHLAIGDMATGFDHFAPVEIVILLGGARHGALNGILDAGGGGADDLDLLIIAIAHKEMLRSRNVREPSMMSSKTFLQSPVCGCDKLASGA